MNQQTTSPRPQQQNQKQDLKEQKQEMHQHDQCCGGSTQGQTCGTESGQKGTTQKAHDAQRSTSR